MCLDFHIKAWAHTHTHTHTQDYIEGMTDSFDLVVLAAWKVLFLLREISEPFCNSKCMHTKTNMYLDTCIRRGVQNKQAGWVRLYCIYIYIIYIYIYNMYRGVESAQAGWVRFCSAVVMLTLANSKLVRERETVMG